MPLTDRAITELENRGIDAEIASSLGVESHSPPHIGDRRVWIKIPYYRNGTVVNHKYRTIGGKKEDKEFHQDTGATQCFWNEDVISDETLADEPLLIHEGEADGLVSIQLGYRRVVSVPNGAPPEAGSGIDDPKYAFIRNAPPALWKAKEIILAVDGDEPGVNLLTDLSNILGKPRCKWVQYPKGTKDINDVLCDYSADVVHEIIKTARWVRVDGVYRMSELPPLPAVKAYDTRISGLSKHYKLRLGDFAVITGIPSSGKTAFINDVACRMADEYGWKTAFASFEQVPQRDHRRALRTWINRKLEIHQDEEEKDRADAWIDRNFVFVVPGDEDDITVKWLLERLDAAVYQHGVKLIIVDPFNEMDHTRGKEQSLTEYVGETIKIFKRFAKRHLVHFVLVAHPAKTLRDKEGKVPIPTLYDISDSAHFYNKADVGIVVHRPDEYVSLIRVAKSRYHTEIGVPGDFTATYDLATGRYTQVSV